MNQAIEKMFNDQLSTAKILVKSDKGILWDLSHYVADNAIGKLMMLKLHEDKTYQMTKVENMKFPQLLSVFQTEFPNINIDYAEIQKQHTNGRNPFQHKLITTTQLGIRQEQSELYINLFEKLMEELKISHPKFDFDLGLNENKLPIKSLSERLIDEFTRCLKQLKDNPFDFEIFIHFSSVVARLLSVGRVVSKKNKSKVNLLLDLYSKYIMLEYPSNQLTEEFLFKLSKIPRWIEFELINKT